jgi:ribosome-binding protein aMBF1 (putative translation factor)
MKCRTIRPPATEGCGASVTHRITFRDGDKLLVCGDCKLHFEQLAAEHRTTLKVEKLELQTS